MARYIFQVELAGEGDTPEEAWFDATSAFCDDPGDPSPDWKLDEDEDEEGG